VSVIIPTRNRARLLSRALASVLGQDIAAAEILVVDDGSSDDTGAVVARHGPRVRSLQREPGGQAAAMNDGLAAATGDWIAWLDDDDYFLPAKLRLQRRSFDHPRIGLAITAHYIADAEGRPLEARALPRFAAEELLRLLLRGSIFLGPTAMVRREAYAELGARPYDETLPRAADYLMWWRLARRGEVAVVPIPLTVVCRHPGNTHDQARARAIFDSARRTLRWVWNDVPLEELAGGRVSADVVRLERAEALLRVGLWVEAKADLEALGDAAGERTENLLGLLALEQGQLAEAEDRWQRVLARSPGDRMALNGLVTALLLSGRRTELSLILARALKQHPRDPLTRYNAALAEAPDPTHPEGALALARELLAERAMRGALFSPAPPVAGIDAFFAAFRRPSLGSRAARPGRESASA
jgi:tetratricopeptide (TPR) repeat protein